MLTYAADEQEASADKRYGARADYREYKESVSNLIPFPPSLFRPLPLAVKRIFFFEWPIYSQGLKQLALVEKGGEEDGGQKEGGRRGEGGPGDGAGEIKDNTKGRETVVAVASQETVVAVASEVIAVPPTNTIQSITTNAGPRPTPTHAAPPATSVDALLPAGWKASKDQNGNQYYYNTELKVSQWSRPAQ
jgi:hypothetical protein